MLSADIFNLDPFSQYPEFSSFEEAIEWALLMLSGESKMATHEYGTGGKSSFSLSTFDGAHLLAPGLEADDSLVYLPPYSDEVNLDLLGMKAKDISFKLFVIQPKDIVNRTAYDGFPVFLEKYIYLPFKERRGKKFRYNSVLKHRTAYLYDNENWYTQERFFSMYSQSFMNYRHDLRQEMNALKKEQIKKIREQIKGSNFEGMPDSELDEMWENELKKQSRKFFGIDSEFRFNFLYPETGDPNYSYSNPTWISKDVSKRFNMRLSMSLTNYYNWHVYLKEQSSLIGFQVPFLFNDLDSVYSLREMPTTKTGRKKSIIHFVKGHYRRLKQKDVAGNEIGEREVWVRKFIRGESSFKWRGIDVNIIPSKYDLNRVSTSKKFANSRFLD